MTYPRHAQISLQATPYYHCVARCVRRAWLWGYDEYAGKDYSHRKAWVLERFKELSGVFAIDICAYAVMSNHYHLVLHVDRQQTEKWTQEEVIERWKTIFGIPDVVKRLQADLVTENERKTAEDMIETWRARLHDVSWYMRCLNEYLARRGNEEDGCKGRFWEGRFKSQALLDEAGLLTAMAYVDLNPVRAGIAATPEESEFTSIYQRIRALENSVISEATPCVPLYPFQDAIPPSEHGIPFRLIDYLELTDWTGRHLFRDKPGVISPSLPTILQRLNIDATAWPQAMQPSGNIFGRAIGRLERLRSYASNIGQDWVRGLRWAKQLFGQ